MAQHLSSAYVITPNVSLLKFGIKYDLLITLVVRSKQDSLTFTKHKLTLEFKQ